MNASTQQPPAPKLSHPEVLRIIFGVIVAMILAALDQTIVVTALPTIGRNLGNPEYLPWVVTAYLLSSTAVTPLYGKVSDIVGRRKTLLFAISIFVAGSVACGLSPNMLMLIISTASATWRAILKFAAQLSRARRRMMPSTCDLPRQ